MSAAQDKSNELVSIVQQIEHTQETETALVAEIQNATEQLAKTREDAKAFKAQLDARYVELRGIINPTAIQDAPTVSLPTFTAN